MAHMDRLRDDAIETAHEIDLIENVMIQTVTTQMSFTSMMSGLEKGDYVIPGFQRLYRWSEIQVEDLAISLVRGLPIPPVYCYRNSEQQQVILDGQQRMMSLYFYYIGKYLKRRKNVYVDARKATGGDVKFREYLDSCELVDKRFCMCYKEEDGSDKIVDITYQNLSDRLKRKIDFAPITLIEINVDSEKYRERTLHKIFAYLNIGGTPLSGQELRNGIYGCKFYDMLTEINEISKKWRQLFSGNQESEVNKEGKDLELLLTMCAYKYYVKRDKSGFTMTNYKGKISALLNEFSEDAIKFDSSLINEYRQCLLDFFDDLEAVVGRNKSLALPSIFAVWDKLETRRKITKEDCRKIVNNKKYTETIKAGTSKKYEIEKRLRSVYEQLSAND